MNFALLYSCRRRLVASEQLASSIFKGHSFQCNLGLHHTATETWNVATKEIFRRYRQSRHPVTASSVEPGFT